MANSFETERETPEYGSIAELASNIVYRLPGCADEMVRRALRDSYGDFCRLSNALKTERIIPILPRRDRCPITPLTPDCVIESISGVWYHGVRLAEGVDYSVSLGTTPCIILGRYMVPKEEKPGHEIRVVCIEQPKSGSERAPKWFIRKYGDAICAGALVKLFGMTGRPWSDAMQMRMEHVRWDNAVSGARMAVMSGSAFGNGRIDTVDTSGLL